MSGEDFIDTNVFIYLFDESNPAKRRRAESLVHRSLANGSGCISYQVVQETLNVGHPQAGGRDLRARGCCLMTCSRRSGRSNPSRALYARSLNLHTRYGFSFYDSLIVAAALEGGCTRLYTEDLQHGQQVEHLTIQNPFASP